MRQLKETFLEETYLRQIHIFEMRNFGLGLSLSRRLGSLH